MAIILDPMTPNLETRAYFSTKDTVQAIKNLVVSNLDCLCLPLNCITPMPQFINRDNKTNPDENDYRSFIFEIQTGATMECTVNNLSTGASTLITNQDYGRFFDVGTLTDRPRVWRLRVDWNKTFDEDGYGLYQFNFTVKNASSTVIFNEDSICHQLQPWDCEAAAGTVRAETFQSGEIIGGFDYRGIPFIAEEGFVGVRQSGWAQQVRWYGRFFHDVPLTEVDYIDSNSYGKEQVQQLVVRKYNLRLDYTRVELSKPMIEDYFMANKILFSDYNIGQHEILRNVRVVLDEITDFPDIAFSKDVTFNAKFSEFRQDKIKRNN